jgi:hypothetical protein
MSGAAWVTGAAVVAVAATAGLGDDGQVDGGLGDGQLWDLIASGGDVLCGMTIDQAVCQDPRRVEALFVQRIIRPLSLAIVKVSRPWISIEQIDQILKDAYIKRNRFLRQSEGLTVAALARANCSAWKQSSRTLLDAARSGTAEGDALRALFMGNRRDIQRAFDECAELVQTACCIDQRTCEDWMVLGSAVHNMQVVVSVLCKTDDSEVIDAEVLEAEGVPESDRFGALSLDDAVDQFGVEFEHEQYMVSGHRAPAIGLPGYRRMGGRIFG